MFITLQFEYDFKCNIYQWIRFVAAQYFIYNYNNYILL